MTKNKGDYKLTSPVLSAPPPQKKNEKLNISIDDLALSAVLIYSTCSLAAELTVVHWSKKFR